MKAEIKELERKTSLISEQTSLICASVSFLAGFAALYGYMGLGFSSFLALVLLSSATLYVSLLSWIYSRLERKAAIEIISGMQLPGKENELFDEGRLSSGENASTLASFEKWFLPIAAIILTAGETASAIILRNVSASQPRSSVESPNFNLGLILCIGVAAFILFLAGRYAAGLAFAGKRRQIRAPASYCIFTSFFALFLMGAFLLANFAVKSESWGWRNPDPAVLMAGAILFAAFSLDHLIGFILYFYRPSSARDDSVTIYENRLAGLLVRPEGAWEALNEMLEYQFGISVSFERFTRFLLKAAIPLIVFQLAALLAMSCIIAVPGGSCAFKERFGKRSGGILAPGMHMKLPWPVDKVYYTEYETVIALTVCSGKDSRTDADAGLLWTDLPESAALFLTPGAKAADSVKDIKSSTPAADMVAAEIQILYAVVNPEEYYYRHSNPAESFRKIASNVLLASLASINGLNLISQSGEDFEKMVSKSLVEACGRLSLGVKIMSVSLTRIQPPAKYGTIPVFHLTMIEEQQSRTAFYESEAYADRIIPESRSEADKIIAEAETYSINRTSSAEASAGLFGSKCKIFQRFGKLYGFLSYLEVVKRALEAPQKIVVVPSIADEVLLFDLKNEFSPELLDMVNPQNLEK